MTILEQMKKLEKKYSNDMDFGRIIRDLIRTIDTEVKEFSEEIIDNQPKSDNYIYESPDGGKTIYRRKFGDYDSERELVNDGWEVLEHEGQLAWKDSDGNLFNMSGRQMELFGDK